MSSLDHHIAQIVSRNNWKSATVTERVWNNTEWTADPVLILKADFLVVEFSTYIPGAPPSGTWVFTSDKAQVKYDRTSARVMTSGADSFLHSTQITAHKDQLKYTPQTPEPTAYTWIRIIILTEGKSQ